MIDGIRRVTCVGSGLIGQGWAALFALNGYEVILHDLSEEKLEIALKRVFHHIDLLVDAGLGLEPENAKKKISTKTNLEHALKNVDFVIESVFENLDVKCRLYKEMDAIAPKSVIFASSTSGYMITDIARDMIHHPERAIVAHPWNPVHLVPLVEISPGDNTSKETTETTYKLMLDLGRVPVILKKEVPGFIANRISVVLWREALDLVDKGVASVEDIDKAIRAGPGIRWAIMGPFLTYHLGGGKGGIEYLMRHIGTQKNEWLKTTASWTEFPKSVTEKAITGVEKIVGDWSLEDLEAWRDRNLIALNELLWKDNRELY
jgi:3-hydroxypropionate dehydrogenase (NADP+)